nr:immunoglobulin light chain junction region [Macaca mulatta]
DYYCQSSDSDVDHPLF